MLDWKLTCCDYPIDSRSNDVFVFLLLEHVHALVVDVGGVVDNVDAVLDAHFH
jgi:hypothetical protein